MHLTRLRLNPARRGARKLLTSPQAMHAAVLAGFAQPHGHTQPHARTLWRLDENRDRRITLYLSSPGTPDLTHLVEQAGWPTTETWTTRPYQPFLDRLHAGQQWAFRLTANPVRDGRKTDDAKDTQRFGQVTVQQQIDWLYRRSEKNGFALNANPTGSPDTVVHQRRTHSFSRGNGNRPVTLAAVTYDGTLTVTDAEALRKMISNGIGHARAYGCGMLTLAPLRS
ncbi:type I-E CRISPR-associated protein Cas6/Cse3/CasE [Mangrovihabitans endophyticus]|uniref:Type I-E CRISPR-associated protein Cas6/Cse3/CasE n=1 Tax=Mangrovihabitans endophyticus TaxID=1751298 RepID=A0A8J3FRZ4_9ACTN|nr:type I-E CRISPR-associated protein Cas6/Cse3/CasE [Mangrovihabitans endophyticus]GGL20485.1 type I-E CRISPR-associated protein Cas6/Cse3/CasE [Mangrovihabitans endophyticus]